MTFYFAREWHFILRGDGMKNDISALGAAGYNNLGVSVEEITRQGRLRKTEFRNPK
jgi:hypothetical protein